KGWARTTRTPIAKRRARATWATVTERGAWSAWAPIAKRRTRTWAGSATTRQRRRDRHPFKGRSVATALRTTETLAGLRRATTATLATLATATATTGATRPDRHVAAPADLVVVATAPVGALAATATRAVAVRAHLDDHGRAVVFERWRGGGCDS